MFQITRFRLLPVQLTMQEQGILAVTGTRFAKVTPASDIIANKFTITGKSGGTRTLSSTSNVNTTDETHFTLTISGADKTAVDALIDKNGTSASDGTPITWQRQMAGIMYHLLLMPMQQLQLRLRGLMNHR